MQRYLRKKDDPSEVFIWTELLAKRKDLEEVWAMDAADAKKNPSAPALDATAPRDLLEMTRRQLACFAAFRCDLMLDYSRNQKHQEMVEAICRKLGWEVPKPLVIMSDPTRKLDDPDLKQRIDELAGDVAVGTYADGSEAAATIKDMRIDASLVGDAIDARAMELLEEVKPAKTGASAGAQGSLSDAGVGATRDLVG